MPNQAEWKPIVESLANHLTWGWASRSPRSHPNDLQASREAMRRLRTLSPDWAEVRAYLVECGVKWEHAEEVMRL